MKRGERVWIEAEYWGESQDEECVDLLLRNILEFRFTEGCDPVLTIQETRVKKDTVWEALK